MEAGTRRAYARRVLEDDRTYRFTRRRGTNTANLRDVITKSDHRRTQDLPPLEDEPAFEEASAPAALGQRATGSQRVPVFTPPTGAAVLEPEPAPPAPPAPRVVTERRVFAGVELLIEHCGDRVTLTLPGAAPLVGTRDEVIDLVAALLGEG